jgi:hypothetical protein
MASLGRCGTRFRSLGMSEGADAPRRRRTSPMCRSSDRAAGRWPLVGRPVLSPLVESLRVAARRPVHRQARSQNAVLPSLPPPGQ